MVDMNKVFEKYFIPSNDVLNENRKTCKECGGQCCKSMGCHISPEDLKEITKESIISLIDESGCISIDWYEGNPISGLHDGDYYFLRIRNLNSKIIDPSWGGQCCLLKDNGCPLLFRYRPKGARNLIPGIYNSDFCNDGYSKTQCAIDWMPYRNIIKEVYEYYRDKMEVTMNNPLQQLTELTKMLFGDYLDG